MSGEINDPVRESIMAGSKSLYDFDVKEAREDGTARDTATQIAEAGVERARIEKTLLEQDRRLKSEGKTPQERIAAADAVWQVVGKAVYQRRFPLVYGGQEAEGACPGSDDRRPAASQGPK
jgi:hypothetical protein